MKIQHNISALNSNNRLKENENKIGKSLKKLSSGYRINSAADDAAGLSISEKMRALITGAEQAERNIQDGISLVQTADGAMEEIHQMLNRGKELCMQASNGIYSDSERNSLHQEMESLYQEIDRIANSTKFNKISVLKGNGQQSGNVTIEGGLPAWVVPDASLGAGLMSSVYTTMETYQTTDSTGAVVNTQYPIDHVSSSFDFGSYTGSQTQKDELKQGGFYFTCCTCSNHYSIKFTDGTTNQMEQSGDHFIYSVGIDNINSPQDLVNAIVSAADNGNPQGHYTKLVADPTNSGKLILYDDRAQGAPPAVSGGTWTGWDTPDFYVTASGEYGKVGEGVASAATPTGIPDLVLQIGPNSDETLPIELPNVIPDNMGLKELSLKTPTKALSAMRAIERAIDYVSGERGRVGSYQNRLEHTFSNMGSYVENLTKAESVLRDVDMADEIAVMTKEQILNQAATAMLAQANQQPQQVLQLLQ